MPHANMLVMKRKIRLLRRKLGLKSCSIWKEQGCWQINIWAMGQCISVKTAAIHLQIFFHPINTMWTTSLVLDAGTKLKNLKETNNWSRRYKNTWILCDRGRRFLRRMPFHLPPPWKKNCKNGSVMYPEVLLALWFRLVKEDTVDLLIKEDTVDLIEIIVRKAATHHLRARALGECSNESRGAPKS